MQSRHTANTSFGGWSSVCMCVFFPLLTTYFCLVCLKKLFLRLEAQRCFALWGHFRRVLIFWCGLLMLETLIDLKVIKILLAAGRFKVIFLPQISRTLLNCICSATGLKSVWQHMKDSQDLCMCVFLSSRPHENVSHSTKSCSNTPEADQRSSNPPEHSGDPQRWRCWARRAQPTGSSTAAICF